MVVFVDTIGNFYVYRENDKPGIPVIVPHPSMSVSEKHAIHITVRNGKMVESYSFGKQIGKDKIVKIPVEGAAVYIAFGDAEERTIKDSFDNAVQPNVRVDYSAIDIVYGKWIILAPSTEGTPVELSKSILQQILDQ